VLLLAAKPWSGSTLKRYRKRVAAISWFLTKKRKRVDVSENAKKPIISAVLLLHFIIMNSVLLIGRIKIDKGGNTRASI